MGSRSSGEMTRHTGGRSEVPLGVLREPRMSVPPPWARCPHRPSRTCANVPVARWTQVSSCVSLRVSVHARRAASARTRGRAGSRSESPSLARVGFRRPCGNGAGPAGRRAWRHFLDSEAFACKVSICPQLLLAVVGDRGKSQWTPQIGLRTGL